MMIRKRRFFSYAVGLALCWGCAEEEKPMFDFTIEHASGPQVELTLENIVGRWEVNRMYNDYSDLTAFSPTLRSGFLELREDLTYAYCRNHKMDTTTYRGRINLDSLSMGIINLVDTPDPLSPGFNAPIFRLLVKALTEDQLELDWEHFDPEVGSSGGGSQLLFEFEFKYQPEDDPLVYPVSRDQLKPTIYHDKISVTNFEAMFPYQTSEETWERTKLLWQYARTSQEEGGDGLEVNAIEILGDSVIIGGFANNLDNSSAQKGNAHFYVSSEEMIVIDSLGFTGRRKYAGSSPDHASRVMFYWSKGLINEFSSATAYHEFAKTGDVFSNKETSLKPTLTPVKGKGFWLGIAANIGGSANGEKNKLWGAANGRWLVLHNIKVYGRIYKGERFHYYYLMNKQQ